MARRIILLSLMLLLLLLALAMAITSAYQLQQAYAYNGAVEHGQLSKINTANYLFHDAVVLAERGKMQAALARYISAATIATATLREAAYYNSGNLYLRQAMQLLDTQGLAAWDNVNPLLAMAKDSYRSALRINPHWLEAKYNLELCLRLSPDLKTATRKVQAEEEAEDIGDLAESWPAIPGFPRGMP